MSRDTGLRIRRLHGQLILARIPGPNARSNEENYVRGLYTRRLKGLTANDVLWAWRTPHNLHFYLDRCSMSFYKRVIVLSLHSRALVLLNRVAFASKLRLDEGKGPRHTPMLHSFLAPAIRETIRLRSCSMGLRSNDFCVRAGLCDEKFRSGRTPIYVTSDLFFWMDLAWYLCKELH